MEDLIVIVKHLADLDTLIAKRDNALLQIGYFGGYRRSELVGLKVEDLAWELEGIVVTLLCRRHRGARARRATFPRGREWPPVLSLAALNLV